MSVRYVENAVQVFSAQPRAFVVSPQTEDKRSTERRQGAGSCILCRQPAVFVIPDGEVCDEHAWQAAARLDWNSADIWVPFKIDRSNA